MIGLFFLVFIISFFYSIPQVSAVGEVYVCAEKTLSGAWCMNVPQNQVNTAFRQASSNCEATAFCRMGTCVDNQQGECRPNVPQRVCQAGNGFWVQGKPEEIPQCQLGCCLAGDQAAFVTPTGCKAIASQYGVVTNFNSQVRDYDQCLALSNPKARGACVIDDGFQRDCKNIASAECNALNSGTGNRTVRFNEGFLCTAEFLATRCAPTEKTTCVEGKFGVYFLDSCGNVANIYDSEKLRDKQYWNKIVELGDSSICGSSLNNAGSDTCGNCDYQAGSICKPYQRNSAQTPNKPLHGNFVCADLSCKYKGDTYLHGESWCANDSVGTAGYLPGSESYVRSCYNGKVSSSQCDSLRQSICREDTSNEGYLVAECVANSWRDCVDQKNQTSCENVQKRDCKWMLGSTLGGVPSLKDSGGYTYFLNNGGELVPRNESNTGSGAACVPRYAPGLNETGTESACFAASESCVVQFEKKDRFADWHCVVNCQCLNKAWADGKINQCLALGDCGVKNNYVGVRGESHDPFAVEGRNITVKITPFSIDRWSVARTQFP